MGEGAWGGKQKNGAMSYIEVKRDREWFEHNFPIMEAWYARLQEECERRDGALTEDGT
jgi:hypothetical protein